MFNSCRAKQFSGSLNHDNPSTKCSATRSEITRNDSFSAAFRETSQPQRRAITILSREASKWTFVERLAHTETLRRRLSIPPYLRLIRLADFSSGCCYYEIRKPEVLLWHACFCTSKIPVCPEHRGSAYSAKLKLKVFEGKKAFVCIHYSTPPHPPPFFIMRHERNFLIY